MDFVRLTFHPPRAVMMLYLSVWTDSPGWCYSSLHAFGLFVHETLENDVEQCNAHAIVWGSIAAVHFRVCFFLGLSWTRPHGVL